MGNNPDVWNRVKAAIERVAARENGSTPRKMRTSDEEIWQMYCQGLTKARIARVCGIPYGTMSGLIARLKRKHGQGGDDGSQHL